MAVACAVAQTLLNEKTLETNDPFSRRDGWQSHGVTVRRFEFEFHGELQKAALTYLHDGALHLAAGDAVGVLTFAQTADGINVQFAGQRITASAWPLLTLSPALTANDTTLPGMGAVKRPPSACATPACASKSIAMI